MTEPLINLVNRSFRSASHRTQCYGWRVLISKKQKKESSDLLPKNQSEGLSEQDGSPDLSQWYVVSFLQLSWVDFTQLLDIHLRLSNWHTLTYF